ncbi:MAG: DUF488 family protein [Candidatus Methanoperedenaceae archaeon]|nr:DUF488 family protein [Candidatus Methanoperedenaceae archaeon]
MLKETYLGNVRNLPRDSIVVEVTRSKKHVLSPSWNLLNDYKNGKIDWNGYKKRFLEEMDNEACRVEMHELWELSRTRDVYLVCFEKEGHCHRFLLLELINKMWG